MSVATLPEKPRREVHSAPVSVSYVLPSERPFWVFLGSSVAILALAVVGYSVVFRSEPAPKTVEIDLGDIAAVPGEPPPKGDSSATSEPTPAPTPEATPEPSPEPTPEPPPPPEEKPAFIKPAPAATPTPPPRPKPVAAHPPQPPTAKPPASAPAKTASAPVGTPATVRGTPTGVAGGSGGSRGDFTATPKPQYDATALQRHYQGSGDVLITYANGSIVSVVMTRSTGVPYLDAKTTSWVKSAYRVKPGVSGKATFSINWTLPH